MMLIRYALVPVLLVVALSACTYDREGDVSIHYNDFHTIPPKGNTVTVCHAYGCQKQTRFRFTADDIAQLKALMKKIERADTPFEELRGVAYAIAWMEKRTGDVIGTSADRPGMEFNGSGDPTQQDCVDEATNTTSYMLVLQHNGLLRHHHVSIPISKGNILMGAKYWPHWTGILTEDKTGQRYAVDSWIYANGENPAIVEVEKWYIKDIDRLPKSTN